MAHASRNGIASSMYGSGVSSVSDHGESAAELVTSIRILQLSDVSIAGVLVRPKPCGVTATWSICD